MYSFLVLLFAMLGNARINGIDLGLAVLAPACLFMFFLHRPRITLAAAMGGAAALAVGAILTAQAVRIEVFELYSLWPLKALLVALLVSVAPKDIDKTAFLGVVVLCVVLFVTSTDQLGRSYGLFGPNMLYRFYGLLFALCLIGWLQVQKRPRFLTGMGFAALGVTTTGSAGGLMLLLAIMAYVFNKVLRAVAAGLIVLILVWLFWGFLQDLVVIQRTVAKLDLYNLFGSTRIVNGGLILGKGLAFWGQPYDLYGSIWQPLYLYPHNIFVELIAFFGISGALIGLCLIYGAIDAWFQIRRGSANIFTFVFISVFIGANFSAELSDNYGCIGLALARLLSWFIPPSRKATLAIPNQDKSDIAAA